MAKTYRVKCPHCGEIINLPGSGPCTKCGTPISVDTPASVTMYRMGNFVGAANGFGIYINNVPFGHIGNRETLVFPLPYGDYLFHAACGMNRKCNDPVIHLSAQDPHVCLKVQMEVGFFQNTFRIDRVDPSTMPKN